MNDYKPLNNVCGAVRWLASESVLNETAAGDTVTLAALVNEMPDDAREDWDDAQMARFADAYNNKRMRAVIVAVWWPAYHAEKSAFAPLPANNPWT